MNKNILSTIRTSGGRFFGLYTKDGRRFNAQLIRETPKGVRIYDRNSKSQTLVTKRNIKAVQSRGRMVTA